MINEELTDFEIDNEVRALLNLICENLEEDKNTGWRIQIEFVSFVEKEGII